EAAGRGVVGGDGDRFEIVVAHRVEALGGDLLGAGTELEERASRGSDLLTPPVDAPVDRGADGPTDRPGRPRGVEAHRRRGDDDLRTGERRQVEVRRGVDAAVDERAPAEADRLVEAGDRAGGEDRPRERRTVVAAAEDEASTGLDVDRAEPQRLRGPLVGEAGAEVGLLLVEAQEAAGE